MCIFRESATVCVVWESGAGGRRHGKGVGHWWGGISGARGKTAYPQKNGLRYFGVFKVYLFQDVYWAFSRNSLKCSLALSAKMRLNRAPKPIYTYIHLYILQVLGWYYNPHSHNLIEDYVSNGQSLQRHMCQLGHLLIRSNLCLTFVLRHGRGAPVHDIGFNTAVIVRTSP